MFVQPELDMMLRARLERYPCVEVRLGARGAAARRCCWPRRRSSSPATGRRARSAASLGIRLVDLGFDEDWLVVDVMLHDDRRHRCRRSSSRCAIRIGRRRSCRRTVAIGGGSSASRRGESLDPWALLAPWGIRPDRRRARAGGAVPLPRRVAERWRGGPDGRVFLAGDAAHQMPPFMGQGMCSGVRDAANLAWKLDEVVRGAAPASLLDTYESERRPHVEAVIALSIGAGRLLRDLSAAVRDGGPLTMPEPDAPDPRRWSRLPGLDLGGAVPGRPAAAAARSARRPTAARGGRSSVTGAGRCRRRSGSRWSSNPGRRTASGRCSCAPTATSPPSAPTPRICAPRRTPPVRPRAEIARDGVAEQRTDGRAGHGQDGQTGLRAATGSRRAARAAGASPASSPTTTATPTPPTSASGGMSTGQSLLRA